MQINQQPRIAVFIHVEEPEHGDIRSHSTEPSREDNIPRTPFDGGRNRDLREGLDPGEIDVFHPCALLSLDFLEGVLEFGGDYYVAEDVKTSLFHGVTELDQFPGSSRVVDQEQDLWTPEFDVLSPQPQQVLPHLVVDQTMPVSIDMSKILRSPYLCDTSPQGFGGVK